MSNILAIAQKELRSYFVSPIAYVVVGLFAVLFGYFFVASLTILVRFSQQAGMFQTYTIFAQHVLLRGAQAMHNCTTDDLLCMWQHVRHMCILYVRLHFSLFVYMCCCPRIITYNLMPIKEGCISRP